MTPAKTDNRPVSIRHRGYDPGIAHGWAVFHHGWLTTTCARSGEAFAQDEYTFFPAGTPVTCITCLVAKRR